MLLKRFFLGALLLTVLVMIDGCAVTGESENNDKTQYRNASDECIRFGFRRDSPEFKRCVEKRLESGEESSSSEQE